MALRADLHIYSRHSKRNTAWLFRHLGIAASYTQPKEIHRLLRAAGMDFVTLTDEGTIDGCLEIAHLPGAFISESLLTSFPGDRVQFRVLAWGITEAQHKELLPLAANIHDLQTYLSAQRIAHAVAHPLYALNRDLRDWHVEKLLLLFKHFEGLNGHRHETFSATFRHLCAQLTPAFIHRLADKHRLAPTHPEPWRKILTGGSDDYTGLTPAIAWTETTDQPGSPAPATPDAFLAEVQAGRCQPGGQGGTSLRLSHALYSTAYTYFSERLRANPANSSAADFLDKIFARFLDGQNPTTVSLLDRIYLLLQGVATGQIFELAKPGGLGTVALWQELAVIFDDPATQAGLARATEGIPEAERRAFATANFIANTLMVRFFDKALADGARHRYLEAFQKLGPLVPILLSLSPYLYAFRRQSPERRELRRLARLASPDLPPFLQNRKRAWFTDTLDDMNGVAMTIRRLASAGLRAGADLTVVTCRPAIHVPEVRLKNFLPLFEFSTPEYERQTLTLPPFLEIVDYLDKGNFTEVIISTPGPLGVMALLAARMLNLPITGIYHTDFPQYIRAFTQDNFWEDMTWKFMRWFHSDMDLIYANSEHYRQQWITRGLPADRLRLLPRGLDTHLFHPGKRQAATFFNRWRPAPPASPTIKLLYVGRISREKDLALLAALLPLLAARPNIEMIFVGDGPYRDELRRALPAATFTGPLTGEDLAAAYASSDIFLFPSTTDTYGNVVVEAQAAGIAPIVSDLGGPKDLVEHGVTGLVTRALDAADFTAALERLLDDESLRRQIGKNARLAVQDSNWDHAFRRFWAMTEF